MSQEPISIEQKILRLNLDKSRYGTLAEIGAGQEVARAFFRVGGAAGTVAKTMSAYDMKVSDAIYGPSPRYVSRERLEAMLKHEFSLVNERLASSRGDSTAFFAFADTAAGRSFSRPEDGLAWVGIRFQHRPQEDPSDIILHARLLDPESVLQHEALGILGVNLIYGACYLHESPEALVSQMGDPVTPARVELNLVDLSGPAFAGVDTRLLNLHLIERKLSHAVLFHNGGQPVEPGSVLYKKPLVVLRGTFRPVLRVHVDILDAAAQQFRERSGPEEEVVSLAEISTRNVLDAKPYPPGDVLARVDTLSALGLPVLVTDLAEFYGLEEYLSRYSKRDVAFAIGAKILERALREEYYEKLDGGLLEGLGRLFKRRVRFVVYPSRQADTKMLLTAQNVEVTPHIRHLLRFLVESGQVDPLREYREENLGVSAAAVFADLQSGGTSWETVVPEAAVTLIKQRRLFDYPGCATHEPEG
ncbi:MAG TPA: TonB-dependent receptor [Terriglobia bacterium]|nr:TonB-dependent receptor [Terriglobia bacterium]